MACHLVTEERGSGWDPGREREQQDRWDDHADFMDGLAGDGFVVLGGPVGDGLLVFLAVEAPDEVAVRETLAADPWMKADILRVARIEPWHVRLRGPRDRTPRFVATRRRGPRFDGSRPLDEQDDWAAHAAFMDGLAAGGVIVLGGPLGEGDRTLLAFDAASEEQVRARLGDDPWAPARLLELVSVEPWEIRLDGR
jgi:uncharacterized protein YciI